MDNLQALIDGSTPLHKNAHLDTNGHFKDRGYKEILPNQVENAPRELLRSFYEQSDMFSLTDHTLKQQRTVYKVDEKFEIQFAATFFVIELDSLLVFYLDVIKSKTFKQGFGSQFIRDLINFLEIQLEIGKKLKGAHLFVGQSQILKPHVFFQKHKFGPLPQQFNHLKLEGSDLAYRKLTKSLEEEKGSAGRREKKANDKFDDDEISVVSVVTNKTSKSKNGKALDKRCSVCKKTISGANWNRHVTNVHKGLEPSFVVVKDNTEKNEIEVSIDRTTKTNHGCHKMSDCSKCGKDIEVRRLTDGLCATCQKVKAKTLIDVPTSNFLNAAALSRLSDQSQLIKPSDSSSVVGSKRRHELMQ